MPILEVSAVRNTEKTGKRFLRIKENKKEISQVSKQMAKGGKSLNDREESAKTRRKVLNCINKVYDGEEGELTEKQWELTLRMAVIVLPRLNEHTGEDGGPIQLEGVNIKIQK